MSRLPQGRRTERVALNALSTLLESHDHIVHRIDGGNDFGEDLEVEFTEDGERTGDTIRIQVKGGTSHRSARGYRVSIGGHERDWADGNVPVVCVVHDPEVGKLFWANATADIRAARRARQSIKSIEIGLDAVLDNLTLETVVRGLRKFLNIYHGNRTIEARLAEMADIELDPQDWIQHFVNEHGEDAIFWQRPGEAFARLLHADLDWESREITPEMLHFDTIRDFMEAHGDHELLRGVQIPEGMQIPKIATVGGVILNEPEAYWLAACFGASEWMRGQR
jgi:Domain of unknown function (DUF4365)